MDEAHPPNRFELRRRRSRAALIEAAIELFQTKGVQSTSLEEICERADVAVRTFFNHFETREHLHETIAHQRVAQIAELLDGSALDERPFATRMQDVLTAIGVYLAARPAYRDFVGEMLKLRTSRTSEAVRSGSLGQAVHRFVEDGVVRGEVSRTHSSQTLADLMLGAITIALSNWSASSDYDLERGLDEAARALSDLFAVNTDTESLE